jgi:hypothetical protein
MALQHLGIPHESPIIFLPSGTTLARGLLLVTTLSRNSVAIASSHPHPRHTHRALIKLKAFTIAKDRTHVVAARLHLKFKYAVSFSYPLG